MNRQTLLSFYQTHDIDPVPIDLSDDSKLGAHLAKRRNLYDLHLGIPLCLLQHKTVLEFGCNSGENALVLASHGAELTLVEPNTSQHPKLLTLFKAHHLENRIRRLSAKSLETFETDSLFDLVICENFINCLSQRDAMVAKICHQIKPGAYGVISYDDLCGSLIEVMRRFVFFEIFRASSIGDIHSRESLQLATELFLDDFRMLNASRPFDAWWLDVITNPFVSWQHLWRLQDILPIIAACGCEYVGGSPPWVTIDHMNWYKNVMDPEKRHAAILDQWYLHFGYFITGIAGAKEALGRATPEIVRATEAFLLDIEKCMDGAKAAGTVSYPALLEAYLARGTSDGACAQLNADLKRVVAATGHGHGGDIRDAYKSSARLRHLWGTPCHYLSIRKHYT